MSINEDLSIHNKTKKYKKNYLKNDKKKTKTINVYKTKEHDLQYILEKNIEYSKFRTIIKIISYNDKN